MKIIFELNENTVYVFSFKDVKDLVFYRPSSILINDEKVKKTFKDIFEIQKYIIKNYDKGLFVIKVPNQYTGE
jgi:hypothetical protein